MAHVKGHKVNVPAQKVKENEVKDSFFSSFKKERIVWRQCKFTRIAI